MPQSVQTGRDELNPSSIFPVCEQQSVNSSGSDSGIAQKLSQAPEAQTRVRFVDLSQECLKSSNPQPWASALPPAPGSSCLDGRVE